MTDLERVEKLIASAEKSMNGAKYANIRDEYEKTWYEARILRAKMLHNLNEAINLIDEYAAVLKKRTA